MLNGIIKEFHIRLLPINTWVPLSVDTALDCDVTREFPVTIIIHVLPLAVAGWTPSSAHALDETIIATSYPPISMPGAVTVSVQIAAITLPVDWRPLLLLSSGLIAVMIPHPTSPILSCCSGDGQCD